MSTLCRCWLKKKGFLMSSDSWQLCVVSRLLCGEEAACLTHCQCQRCCGSQVPCRCWRLIAEQSLVSSSATRVTHKSDADAEELLLNSHSQASAAVWLWTETSGHWKASEVMWCSTIHDLSFSIASFETTFIHCLFVYQTEDILCKLYTHVCWFIELYLVFLLPLNCNIFVVVSVKIRTLRCTAHSCVCWWEGTVLVAAHRSSGPLLCPVAQPRVQLWSSASFLHTVVSVHT